MSPATATVITRNTAAVSWKKLHCGGDRSHRGPGPPGGAVFRAPGRLLCKQYGFRAHLTAHVISSQALCVLYKHASCAGAEGRDNAQGNITVMIAHIIA